MKKSFFPALHFLLTKIYIFKRVKLCKNLITIQSNFSHFLGQLAKSFPTKQDTMPQNSWLCAELDERDQHKYGSDNKY